MKAILKVDNITTEERYLGLPTPEEGRMEKDKFTSVKERLTERFTNTAEKHMSTGAKDVLIKSAAQVIPTYVMEGF
jgi:hypothetical protein